MSRNKPSTPSPLLSTGVPVNWWFIFKLNTEFWEGCGSGSKLAKKGLFGGNIQDYDAEKAFGLQYVYSSSKKPKLQKGSGCLGSTLSDPLGATFDQVYNGSFNYVIWNDQFYGEPIPSKGSPWGHSKGMLAWDDAGNGLVMQVSTPSWPGSGSKNFHRGKTDGNTLGYVKDDDVEVSQHFFALKLTRADTVEVLQAVRNAKVVTRPGVAAIVNNGGPSEISDLVNSLGKTPKNPSCTLATLSSGVQLISKPSDMCVPPWQLVSAKLSGVPLRVASWWAHPKIYSTVKGKPLCWDPSLAVPGAVEIATTGTWDGTEFSLVGGSGFNRNHAKVGVSTNPRKPYSVFGDMNQQGALKEKYAYSTQKCSSSQNGRGGTFYVLENKTLFSSLSGFLEGDSAPTERPS